MSENQGKMQRWFCVLHLMVILHGELVMPMHEAASLMSPKTSQLTAQPELVPARDLDQLMEAELSESSPGVMAAVYSWLGSLFEGSGTKKVDDVIAKSKWSGKVVPNVTLSRLPPLSNLIDPELELLDEVNDREIFRAVLHSLAEWNLNKVKRKKQTRKKRDEEVVCYPDVGCFRDEGPFDYLDLLPSPPEEINTRFFLYTPRNAEVPHVMTYNNVTSILTSPFNATHASKIIVHGFGSSCHRVWAREMRLALMSVGEANVICVDWENGASLPNYVRAAVNTRLVGKQVALMVNALNNLTNSNNANFHLIGFSLGAHVAGFAGSELRNVSRITGLDPAGPLFENYDPRARLDSTDADLVDVIHSNGESLIMGGLGAWAPMGHMDFYPNGGRMQKGCSNLFIGAVSDIIWSSAEENGRSLCNHRRAYKFFTDSVLPGCHFPAFACESYEKLLEGDCFPCSDLKQCANMGYFADKSDGRGVLYLATREEEPFCANQFRVQLHSTPTRQPFYTHGKIELIISANDVNETFSLTRNPDEEIHSGGRLLRLIVAPPTLKQPTKVRLTYTAYNGWISSGLSYWSIDKLVMMDSFGNTFSHCQSGVILQSGLPAVLNLVPGDCNMLPNSAADNGAPWQPIDVPPAYPYPDGEGSLGLDPLLSGNVLRMLRDNYTVSSNNSIEKMSHIGGSYPPLHSAGVNGTSSLFPYGNVPLSVLQQHADIKVATRRPSFYQWPFVSAGQVKAKLKSLGGIRKQEPHSQLIPPQPAPNSRRSYFRRNNRNRNRNQQLYPQPLRYSAASTRPYNEQFSMPVEHMQRTFAQSLLSQPLTSPVSSNRNVVSTVPSPVIYSSFSSTPILQYLPVLNQTSVSVQLVTVPTVTILPATATVATVEPKAADTGDLVESESIQTLYKNPNSDAALVLTGVEAPLLNGAAPGSRDPVTKLPDAELLNVTSTEPSIIPSTPITELPQGSNDTLNSTQDPVDVNSGYLIYVPQEPQATVEIVPIDIPIPGPYSKRDEELYEDLEVNKEPLPVSFPINKDPAAEPKSRRPTNAPTNPTVSREVLPEPVRPVDDSVTRKEPQDAGDPPRELIQSGRSSANHPYPFSWAYYTDSERIPYVRYMFGTGDVSIALQPEELFPNPAQLGQARDQYWSLAKKTPRTVAAAVAPPPPWVLGGAVGPKPQPPRYIPLNPADRQSRMLQPQYYVEPPGPVSTARTSRYTEYVLYPNMRST